MSPSTATPLSKILLVGERRTGVAGAPAVRRYRLARLRLDDRAPGAGRHDHLRRSHD